MERLQKILAAAGVASRRGAEDLIRDGRVRVNGRIATIGQGAAPGDDITVDGRPIGRPLSLEYIAVNKPAGYACTRHDPHLPRTVYDLLPPDMGNLFTVGRLDVDTEGLLLMTNDGEWANRVMHPRRHVPKTYVASVSGRVTRDHLDPLRRGVRLDDGVTLPADAGILWDNPERGLTALEIVLTEGRKRQVRRMLRAVGLHVRYLERVRVGPVRLDDLPTGRWRRLSPWEVDEMMREARG